MNAELLNRLDVYAQKLGVAADKLMEYMLWGVRACLISDIVWALICIGLFLSAVWFVKRMFRFNVDDSLDHDLVKAMSVFAGVVVIVGAVVVFANCFNCAIQDLLAPEAKAILNLVRVVK